MIDIVLIENVISDIKWSSLKHSQIHNEPTGSEI